MVGNLSALYSVIFCLFWRSKFVSMSLWLLLVSFCVSKRIIEIADKRMMLFIFWILPMALIFFRPCLNFLQICFAMVKMFIKFTEELQINSKENGKFINLCYCIVLKWYDLFYLYPLKLLSLFQMNIADHPFSILRNRFGTNFTDTGYDLLNQ